MAVHNAGHVMACLATGQTFQHASAEMCHGIPLGIRNRFDKLAWEAMCLAGVVAEATAGQPGPSDETLLERIRNEYQPADSSGIQPAGGDGKPAADQTSAVLALAIVSANWADIQRIALALCRSAHPLSQPDILREVRNRRGADISGHFERWQRAVTAARPLGGPGLVIMHDPGSEAL
jgi:hypothetical protein